MKLKHTKGILHFVQNVNILTFDSSNLRRRSLLEQEEYLWELDASKKKT